MKQKIGQLECTICQSTKVEKPTAAVILCHGFGASGADLVSLANEFMAADTRLANAVYIFPTAPIELDPAFDSRAWWMIDIEKIQQLMLSGQTREMRNESPSQLPACRQMIFEIIDAVKQQYSLASSQIIVGGFSQGSMLSTDVALNYVEPLGGLIVWSGALINADQWTAQAERQSPLSVVQTHGRSDPILPIAGGRDLQAMLTAAGHHVAYEEFAGQHTIPLIGLQLAANLIASTIDSTLPLVE